MEILKTRLEPTLIPIENRTGFLTPNLYVDLALAQVLIFMLLGRIPLILKSKDGNLIKHFECFRDIEEHIKEETAKAYSITKQELKKKGNGETNDFAEYCKQCKKFVSSFQDPISLDDKLQRLYINYLVAKSEKNAFLVLIASSLTILKLSEKGKEFTVNDSRATERDLFLVHCLTFSSIHSIYQWFYLSLGVVYQNFLSTSTKKQIAELELQVKALTDKAENTRAKHRQGGKNSAYNYGQPKIKQCVEYIKEHFWLKDVISPSDYADWLIEQVKNKKSFNVGDETIPFKAFKEESLKAQMVWCLDHFDELKKEVEKGAV